MTTVEWLDATSPRLHQTAAGVSGKRILPTQVQLTYDSSKATYRVALERFVSH